MFKAIPILVFAALSLVGFAVNAKTPPHSQESIMQSVTLQTQAGPLAANLYLPKGVKMPPLVIVTGAWTTVKEQMPAVYAEALSKRGYAALTFDFRGWGESKDPVQYLEDPARKTQDIRAVIDALSQLKQVDDNMVAGLGICASSGYMLDAALGNDRIQSVALVAPWLHDKAMATEIYGGEESVAKLLADAQQAAHSPSYIEAASNSNPEALMYQVPYYTENDRGLIPEYDNKFNLASWSGWLNYDALKSASKQDKPVLMVASDSMALPVGAHRYLDKAGPQVQAKWLEGFSQFDFYDQEQAVQAAVDAVTEHFSKTL